MIMYKKRTERKGWFYLAVGCLIVSLISLFLPIIRYTDSIIDYQFNIIDLVKGNSSFEFLVLEEYTGPVLWKITDFTVSVLAVIAVVSLFLAVAGLITLRAQRPNTKQFVLTIIGLIGVSIPSVTVIICVLSFGHYYSDGGFLSLGIAPIISPIALLISIGAVIRRKNKVEEEMRKEAEEKGLIWKAGDL